MAGKTVTAQEVCWACHGQDHYGNADHHLRPGEDGLWRLASSWNNERKKTYSGSTEREQLCVDYLLQRAEKVYPAISMAEVYRYIAENSNLTVASDFVVRLAEHVHIFYSCVNKECLIAPIEIWRWLRGVTPDQEHRPGGEDTHGSWFCGSCLAKWSHKKGDSKRLLSYPVSATERDQVLIGEPPEEEEDYIKLLKIAKLCEKCIEQGTGENLKLGEDALVRAI